MVTVMNIKEKRCYIYSLISEISRCVFFISLLMLSTLSTTVCAAPQLLLIKTVETDLKNTVPTNKALAQVKGYYKKGDGGGGIFRWVNNINPSPAIDGGVVIGAVDSSGVLQGKWVRQTDEATFVNVRWFGIHDDPTIDDSSAIQAAINFAASVNANSRIVHFPRGSYFAEEINWPVIVGLHGEGIGQSRIIYSGTGGSNTALIKATGEGYAHETLEGLSFIGTNLLDLSLPQPPPLVHNLLVFESSIKPAAIDNNVIFRNLQFALCEDDALQARDGWTNFHLDTVRFDAVGGYGVRLTTDVVQDIAPFSIRNFTLDNNISTIFQSDPLAPWGKGLLRVDNGGHLAAPGSFKLDSARLEFNRPLLPVENGVVAAIYMQHALGVGEEYTLEHNSIHITKFINGGSYIHSEARSRNIFTNITFSSSANSFLYTDNIHAGDVEANNFNFIRVFNTQPGLGRPGVWGNNGPNTQDISPNTITQVQFGNGTVKDLNSEWNEGGNFQWICKVAGRYNISFQTGLNNITPGKWVQGRIHLNGIARAISYQASATDTIATFVTVPYTVDMSVGDTIDFYVVHNDIGVRSTIPGEWYSKMSVTRIP